MKYTKFADWHRRHTLPDKLDKPLENDMIDPQKRCLIFGSLILLALLLFVTVPACADEAGTVPETTEQTAENKPSLIDIYTWANKLPKDLIDLRTEINTLADLSGINNSLPEISKQVEDLQWQATTHKSNPNLTYHEITLFESDLTKLSSRLKSYNKSINANIVKLDAWHEKWLSQEQDFLTAIKQIEQTSEMQDSLPDISSLQEVIFTGKKLVERHLRSTLLAGYKVGKIQTDLYELSDTASDLIREMNETGVQQTSPSMLSKDFYDQIDREEFVLGWENIRLFCKYQWTYLTDNLFIIVVSLAIVLLLSFAISLSGRLAAENSDWYIFVSRPLATSVFILCTTIGILNTLAVDIGYPPDWDTLIYLPLFIAVVLLMDKVCRTPWQVTLFRHLMIYSTITLLLSLVAIPQVLFHLFVFYASLLLLGYYLFLFLRRWLTSPKDQKVTWAVILWAVFPLIIIVFGVSGYDQLAVTLFSRILAVVATTITIRLMLMFIASLLEILLLNVPWEIIRKNAATIVQQIFPLIALLHIILWIAVVLTMSWFYPTLGDAFGAMTSIQFTISTVSVTPGSILNIILIIYITILTSRALQAFLLQEVLPRYRVEKGVQLSIARLVHYAAMTIGLLVLLWALGFSLNQITILGGALSVGIGFGLQAIVNNFVSGLILLFERPVKVGDFIDVENQVGEVKELGLRATTVQTFDNAEVVIPNSQLISGSVTNWTLAEKKVRVKAPVGVAYGTDIEEVLRILLACAEANPSVLSTPKPSALFLAFGSSSLDFELRAWIPDFTDKLIVISELNQDIEAEFQTAGIEIPFPQTDLHLRSVDEQAAKTLSGESSRNSR